MASFAMVSLFVIGAVSVSNAQVIPASLSCKQDINVQLTAAPQCQHDVLVDEVSAIAGATGTVFIIRGNTTSNSSVVNGADIGTTVQAVLFQGGATPATAVSKCWTNVHVEDKAPPLIVCPANITVNCGASILPQFTGDLGIILGPGVAIPGDNNVPKGVNGSFQDCSLTTANANVRDESFTDVVTGTACGREGFFVTRTFTLTDHFGNVSLPCRQRITFAPVNINNYVVDNFTVPCTLTDFSPDGLAAAGYVANGGRGGVANGGPNALIGVNANNPGVLTPNAFVSAYPYYLTDTLKLTGTACVQVSYTDVIMFPCPGSQMIMRTFKLFYCGVPTTILQTINVTNTTPPRATITFQDYTSSGDFLCYRDLWGNINRLPANLKCIVTNRTVNFGGNPIVTNLAKGSPYSCSGDASFGITLATPTCGGFGTVTSSDSRFAVTGSGSSYSVVAFGLPFGITPVTFTITDACSGLTSRVTVRVNVTDNVLPEPVCIQDTRVSIGSDGKVRVPASALNSGSHDNCGVKQIFASRMDQKVPVNGTTTTSCGTLVPDLCAAAFGGKDNRIWSDNIEFGCADIGTDVMVMLGVLDNYGNFNFCMVVVRVDNKITPTCIPPPNRTISCTIAAATLANLGSLGRPTAWTNCGVATVSPAVVTGALDNCKLGTITRTWTVTDCTGKNPVTCSQNVTFTPNSSFVVDFPDDISVTCLSAIPAADSLRNQMLDPASFTNGLDGSILNRGCGVINVNITDAPFTANPGLPTRDVCGKILRKITVIDWCKYNPNNDLTDFNSNCYGNPVLGDFHGYNDGGRVAAGTRAGNVAAWQDLDPYRQVNGPAGNYNFAYAALYQGGTVSMFDGNGNYLITSQDRRFEDADLYSTVLGGTDYGPFNLNLATTFFNPTHPLAFSDGIMCFIQLIKIYDQEAPKAVFADTTVCDFGQGQPCFGLYKKQLIATDGCGGRPTNFPNGNGGTASSVRITWTLTGNGISIQNASNDFTGLIQDPTTGLGLSLPYGTYTVSYTATDLCMNIGGPFTFRVTIKDCKTPSLVCLNVVAVNMNSATPGQGTVSVWAKEILSSVNDNCTSDDDLKKSATITLGNATAPGTAITLPLNCNDYIASAPSHIINAKVFIQDAAGNVNNCFVQILLQDNTGACTRPVIGALTGAVKTENSQAVTGVAVNANVGATVSGSSSTIADGTFAINSLALGANYQAKAAKANMGDRATDVTTWDIALVSQHVLGIKALGSAYKIIAADVDKSGEVDATDMLHMRRFILGITSTLPAGTWRFIDKSYAFKNSANPFGEDFPEYVNVNNFTVAQSANFVAVEIGDVNNSYELAPSAVVRTAKTVTLNVDDMNVVAGNEYTVNVTASELNAKALQGTFSFDGATVTSLKPGNLNGISDANFNVKANAVATSWNGEAAKDASVAAITFRADKSGKLSDMLSFGSAITKSEANDAQGNTANVTLKFNTGKVSGSEFALYQNTPNPVENSTKIGFSLPSDQNARLSVIAVDGKVIMVKNISGKAGYNEVSISKSELNASGVFHYRLDTQDNSATKKMIIIE